MGKKDLWARMQSILLHSDFDIILKRWIWNSLYLHTCVCVCTWAYRGTYPLFLLKVQLHSALVIQIFKKMALAYTSTIFKSCYLTNLLQKCQKRKHSKTIREETDLSTITEVWKFYLKSKNSASHELLGLLKIGRFWTAISQLPNFLLQHMKWPNDLSFALMHTKGCYPWLHWKHSTVTYSF